MNNANLAVLTLLAVLAPHSARAADPPPLRVLLTYGGHGFEEKPFFAMWERLPGVTVAKAKLPQEAGLLAPGLEKKCDVVALYDMAAGFTPEQQKAFVALLQRGIGVVALHHNLGAHRKWDEYAKIIGGKFVFEAATLDGREYRPSTYSEGEELKIAVADADHPITRGLKDFQVHDETYKGCYLAPDSRVLLKTDHPKNDPPIAWVRQYGKSRVFYFQLGHDHKAWENPSYAEILLRGLRWAAGRNGE